jgi:hypothetical protein
VHRRPDEQARDLPADLVIDASGRGGLTLDLLCGAGRELPPETVIGVDIGYASATYEVPPGIDRPWKGVLTFPRAPQSARGALMLPQEGGLWLLSLGGRGNDKPPGDEAGFLDFAGHLRTSTIHEAIRGARRVGEIHRAFHAAVVGTLTECPTFRMACCPSAMRFAPSTRFTARG